MCAISRPFYYVSSDLSASPTCIVSLATYARLGCLSGEVQTDHLQDSDLACGSRTYKVYARDKYAGEVPVIVSPARTFYAIKVGAGSGHV